MALMRHAALHAHGQHIIWQQVLMDGSKYSWKLKHTFGCLGMSNMHTPQKTDTLQPKNRCGCIAWLWLLLGRRGFVGNRSRRRNQSRGLDGIELRPSQIQIRLTLFLDLVLVGPRALRRTVAIAPVKCVHHA